MTLNASDKQELDFRKDLRRRLAEMFFNEYKSRKERGELLYEGRWISPAEKLDLVEEKRKEDKALFLDITVLLVIGFIGAITLVLIMRLYFFPK